MISAETLMDAADTIVYAHWQQLTKTITYTGTGYKIYTIDTTGYSTISITFYHCTGYSSLYNTDLLFITNGGTTVYSKEDTTNGKTYSGVGNGAVYTITATCSNTQENKYCTSSDHKIVVTLTK